MFGSRAMTGTLDIEEARRPGAGMANLSPRPCRGRASIRARCRTPRVRNTLRAISNFTSSRANSRSQRPRYRHRGSDHRHRYDRVCVSWQARHSGTTPMAERKDAGRAAAEAIADAYAGYSSVDGARDHFWCNRVRSRRQQCRAGPRQVVRARSGPHVWRRSKGCGGKSTMLSTGAPRRMKSILPSAHSGLTSRRRWRPNSSISSRASAGLSGISIGSCSREPVTMR